MSELLNGPWLWVAVAILAVLALLVIDVIFRSLFDRQAGVGRQYQHRVVSQLPRVSPPREGG